MATAIQAQFQAQLPQNAWLQPLQDEAPSPDFNDLFQYYVPSEGLDSGLPGRPLLAQPADSSGSVGAAPTPPGYSTAGQAPQQFEAGGPMQQLLGNALQQNHSQHYLQQPQQQAQVGQQAKVKEEHRKATAVPAVPAPADTKGGSSKRVRDNNSNKQAKVGASGLTQPGVVASVPPQHVATLLANRPAAHTTVHVQSTRLTLGMRRSCVAHS